MVEILSYRRTLVLEKKLKWPRLKKLIKIKPCFLGDSMLHVNRIYTQHYGFGNRLAIAHMPHLIDRNVFREFKAKFSQQWEETSSHKIRQSNDMQFVSIVCLQL